MILKRRSSLGLAVALSSLVAASCVWGESPTERALAKDFVPEIRGASVRYLEDLDLLVFEMQLDDSVAKVVPAPRGQLDTAPVVGFVFPTNLTPEAVGFREAQGILALAVTAHPDFDDTPLWDEDADRDYGNDGAIFHPHWVVLQPDDRVKGGLSVLPAEKARLSELLPPTNPGMPMYMDSPGHSVVLGKHSLRVLVPAYRLKGETEFQFDAVACYMEVNASDEKRPMLGVYEVYQVLSGDLSLPYSVGD